MPSVLKIEICGQNPNIALNCLTHQTYKIIPRHDHYDSRKDKFGNLGFELEYFCTGEIF